MEPVARRLFRLVEPIHLVTYFAEEPTAALLALGLRNYWDGYFAGRSAPLGRVPAGVVHAVFYNFAPARPPGTSPASGTPDSLGPGELDRLVADLQPLSAALDAAGWA